MTRREMGDVYAALSLRIERVPAGVEGDGLRRNLDPLLSQVPKHLALDLIEEIVGSYDETKDPYGKRRPRLSTFERHLNMKLATGQTATWISERRDGDVVELVGDTNRCGIVRCANFRQYEIWTIEHTKIYGDPYWCIVAPSTHTAKPWQLVRPDRGHELVTTWWKNWIDGVYDGPLPWGAISAAARKYEIELRDADGKIFESDYELVDGAPSKKYIKPEPVRKEPKRLDVAKQVTEVLSYIPGQSIGKDTGDDQCPF